ncbi:hypothetical protein EC973_007780 [Apophysomyces ossiformis]|uniref:JmjC domain-containing protein n=1 Tax=Apophysomyces ossiformis TaxID=679940 RepID=A0A8H7C0M2_9FUNG|nr:hypothetical protein EC973_007780 [Apophysomyces ossiformis]
MPKIRIFESEKRLRAPFVAVARVDIRSFKDLTELQSFIHEQCVIKGLPLVISNMHTLPAWKAEQLDLDHLIRENGTTKIEVLDVNSKIIKDQTLANFIQSIRKAEEHNCSIRESCEHISSDDEEEDMDNTPQNSKAKRKYTKRRSDNARQKNKRKATLVKKRALYAKDISCSRTYQQALSSLVPEFLHPLGSQDLFACLDESLRAENLMCYLGNSGSGTPLHRDICGTFGHNLMTYAESNGYAEWYIIEGQHRDTLCEILQPRKTGTKEGQTDDGKRPMNSFLESDRAWLFQNTYRSVNINVKTHVAIQRPGDLVLIPSLCYHQVRNVGISMKVAWNRTTAYTLRLALEDQLPIYRKIVRPEIYRCKAMVFYALQNWINIIKSYQLAKKNGNKTADVPALFQNEESFLENCRILLHLYERRVIGPETIERIELEDVDDSDIVQDMRSEHDAYTSTCDFCHCDIFYRYYHCDKCENYDLCLDCYSKGRCCQHMDQMVMHQTSLKSLEEYLHLYKDLIDCVNSLFGKKCLFNRLASESSIRPSSEYSLATVCRRMERYRGRNGPLSNLFKCGHCGAVHSLFMIHSRNVDIYTIFARRSCYLLDTSAINSPVFTCEKCTNHCNGCYTLPNHQRDQVKIFYYQDPDTDPRNWGGLHDKGLYMSCHWPDRVRTSIRSDENDQVIYELDNESLEDIQGCVIAALIPHLTKKALRMFGEREGAQKVVRCVNDISKRWTKIIRKSVGSFQQHDDQPMARFSLGQHQFWEPEDELLIHMQKVSVSLPTGTLETGKRDIKEEVEDLSTKTHKRRKKDRKENELTIPSIMLTPRQEKLKQKKNKTV